MKGGWFMLSEIRSHSFLWPEEVFGFLDDVLAL